MSDFDSQLWSLLFTTEKHFSELSLRKEQRECRKESQYQEADREFKEKKDREDRERIQRRCIHNLEVRS